MPPAVIAAVAAVVSAAATTGVGIYEATNQPGQPKIPGPQPMTAAQNKQTSAAVSQQLPTLQSLTGGSVSPEYAAQYGSTQAGVGNDPKAAGDIQSAINNFFGLTAPGSSGLTTTPGGTSGGGGIMDLLKAPTAKPPGAPDTGGGNFVDSLLGGETFKGLAG